MPTARLPAPDEWPNWSLVDRDLLMHARDERPFLETAATLVTEFGELTALLARTHEQPDGVPVRQGRNEAILSGLTTRIVKLTRRLAAETYEGRGELQLLIDREIFTTTAALAYLLRGRGDRFEAFVRDSLRADRDVGSTSTTTATCARATTCRRRRGCVAGSSARSTSRASTPPSSASTTSLRGRTWAGR